MYISLQCIKPCVVCVFLLCDGDVVSGDRKQQSGDFQFELGVVRQSTVSVLSASVRVYVRRKSLRAASTSDGDTTGARRRRRHRFARVAIYRVTPNDKAVPDGYPLAQMASRVRRGQALELLLPTTSVDEALNDARPEARVLRLRIVCHQCRLDNRRRRRQGRRVGIRRPGMASQLVRRRRRGQLQQSHGQLPSLVISFKVKDRSQQPAAAAAAQSAFISL